MMRADQAKDAEGFEVVLFTSDHGYQDYDIKGHSVLRRACVPHDIKKGETFNVYHGESSKSGVKWTGALPDSLHEWLCSENINQPSEV
ncbi:hypothetical protein I4I80_02770 [Pseudomonas syringae pv. tomato]|nr:hypothetical protein [Pseudomonas syringae pv. tomato]MBW8023666.1 hypothetical protein [Pseudomonas syringae pv. tomato]